METVQVNIEPSYQVEIERGLLDQADKKLQPFIEGKKVMIITDENVVAHGYLKNVTEKIEPLTNGVDSIVLPAGEAQKSMECLFDIVQRLAENQYSRTDIVIALGGGVVGDLAGFVSAIYLRGINYIQIPTTLLSAIDSSVGGKTAIDLPQGKNLVGAFYQPKYVLCDPNVFKTLETTVFEDGMAEMIKYGMILDSELLTYLMDRTEPVNASSIDLEKVIARCVAIKRDVVEKDEKDLGLRQLLNYGHTLGHALEQVSHFNISHGRGVAIGMDFMLHMASKEKYIETEIRQDFKDLLNDYHLLNAQIDYSAEEISKAMLNDKKRRSDEITEVLPVSVGQCKLFTFPILEYVEWFTKEWIAKNGN